MKKYILLFGLFVVLVTSILISSCEEEGEQNRTPTCNFISPLNNDTILIGEVVEIIVNADDEDGNLKEILFYVNNEQIGADKDYPYMLEWNTGDKQASSYTIKVEAIDEFNAKAENSITVNLLSNALNANFTVNETTIVLGDTVNFTDLSEGVISSWNWQMGDGSSSNLEKPSHKYAVPGVYTVTLKIQNEFSQATETKTDYITVQTLPTVTTNDITYYNSSSAEVGGNITDDGFSEIIEKGIYYSKETDPVNSGTQVIIEEGVESFIDTLTNLDVNTKYYVCAYAKNAAGENYGEVKSFTTLIGLPAITTTEITNITAISATGGGNVTDDGGFVITAKGTCWSTTNNPTTSDSHTSDGTGIGNFTSNLAGLNANTTYYVRAYATNINGTTYGTELSFTTRDGIPTDLTTTAITNITTNSAVSGGSIDDDGGAAIAARGVCWSTSSNPTISDNYTNDGSGTGSFISNITGLNINTSYYVRSYVTNSIGTYYGDVKSFTTDDGLPSGIATAEISNIGATYATSGGNVSDDGGFSITSRGVCWSTSSNPTISDNYTNDGSGTGSFISNITGLTVNTTYYIRAYATNENGIVYGDEKSFTTDDGLPSGITTAEISNIGATYATSGGNVSDDGGFSITSRGVCWSTSNSPTISDNYTNDGSGTGSFTSDITGLTVNTTYYIRAGLAPYKSDLIIDGYTNI